ncbi:class I SAM-dependent methyltransferase [Caldibacillus lycopersici]|uniref:Class I SAM-dependent methyltransferase n=1 Tax=Perspicuibacillus lycopersici TaxID=1325689 RepID=A0AAE3IQI3_9BACI|nr:class I SAM-dependent methyltransferase [Perspicuibacillus lycopersici]MCU9612347.1 class I SAM-dependent methyltransferase [Perspicuibacillus lycopersici]
MKYTYLDCLAILGVGGAHPGGMQITKKILANESIESTMTVLDSGCGTGKTLTYIAEKYGCRGYGIDSNPLMIEKANQRIATLKLPIKTRVARTESLPFANGSFDLVLSESVIVFTKIPFTLSEFKRVLKPRGKLLAIEMVLETKLPHQNLKEFTDFYQLSTIPTEEEWRTALKRAGFQHVSIENVPLNPLEMTMEDAPDYLLSEQIDPEVFHILAEHERITNNFRGVIGFRVFNCS